MGYWAVAQTESQREHVAANFLGQRDYETYLPKISTKAGGRERVAPLFPGYIFIRIHLHWYSAKFTIGVARILMADDQPATIPDKTITAIQKREGNNGIIKLPKAPGMRQGQRVRVTQGSFAGLPGVYDGMIGTARAWVLLELLGRSVPVSLATADMRADETISTPCV